MRRPSLAAGILLLLALPGAGQEEEKLVGTPVTLALPEGVAGPYVPFANPLTKEKVALGRKLFFEKALSFDRTIACASCHDPRLGYSNGLDRPKGIRGQIGVRSAPTVLNVAFVSPLFWDGRVATLEEQAKGPLTNPVEMGLPDLETAVARVREEPGYSPLLVAAYGDPAATVERVTGAIATFERTLVSLTSPFERWQDGDEDAVPDAAKRGWKLFRGKAGCVNCHSYNPTTPFFTDFGFHNEGVAVIHSGLDALARKTQALKKENVNVIAELAGKERFGELGRFLVTGQRRELGAWKTPMLRNVANTAPYMHDGSLKTLRDVVDFYDKGGSPNTFLDGSLQALELSEGEKESLVALLRTFAEEPSFNFDQKALEALAEQTLGALERK